MRRSRVAAAATFVVAIAVVGVGSPQAHAAAAAPAATRSTATVSYCRSVFGALQPFAAASTALGSIDSNNTAALLSALHGWSSAASSGRKKMLAVAVPSGTSAQVRTDVQKLGKVLKTAASEAKSLHTKAQVDKLDATVTTMDKDLKALDKACGA